MSERGRERVRRGLRKRKRGLTDYKTKERNRTIESIDKEREKEGRLEVKEGEVGEGEMQIESIKGINTKKITKSSYSLFSLRIIAGLVLVSYFRLIAR